MALFSLQNLNAVKQKRSLKMDIVSWTGHVFAVTRVGF